MKGNYQMHRVGVLYLYLCASVICTAGCDSNLGALEERLNEIIAVDAPEERYTRLLELHLAGCHNLSLAVNAGKTALELGRLREAELWLEKARCYFGEKGSTDQESGAEALMWLLSARCSFEQRRFRKCIDYSEQAAKCLAQNKGATGAELLTQVRLLEARSRLAAGIEPLKGCNIIDSLAESYPDALVDRDILQAAEVVVHRVQADFNAEPLDDDRLDQARNLLRIHSSSGPFSVANASAVVELCRRCGMDAEYYIGQLELEMFSSAAECDGHPKYIQTGGVQSEKQTELRSILKFIAEERWSDADAAVQSLRESVVWSRHRFVQYVCALSRLYCEPESEAVREEYARLVRQYGSEQLYFVHLYRALGKAMGLNPVASSAEGMAESIAEGMAPGDRLLYREALWGCIAAAPYTAAAGEARAILAVLAGIPSKYHARPLLPAEMRRIAGIVQSGGPPQLLQPLIEALAWPENQFTLEAGLILRRLRGRPVVRSILISEMESAEQRKRERLRAILQL